MPITTIHAIIIPVGFSDRLLMMECPVTALKIKDLLKLAGKLVLGLFLAFLLFEAVLAIACSRGLLPIPIPSYRFANITSQFWVDMNSDFGVWHEPNSSYYHVTTSYKVSYQANSWGARDRERLLDSVGRKRVIVLGDSFTEGYGVETGKRFSDLLETATGLEHLNFGTAGSFGPTQYYLLYKTMAKKFSHDAVMVCILPFNDFLDDDYDYGKVAHSSRYRPFFTGRYPDYRLTYPQKELPPRRNKYFENFLREFTYTGNLLKFLKDIRKHKATNLPADYAGYFDYTREQWQRLCYVLGLIKSEAGGRQVIILTIPSIQDFARLDKGAKPALPDELAAFCKSAGMTYLDILPAIKAAPKGYRTCYYSGDPHWNAAGNRIAADYIRSNVEWYKKAETAALPDKL